MVDQLVFVHLVDMALDDGMDALVRVACESLLYGQPAMVFPLTVVLRIPSPHTHTHTHTLKHHNHPRYDDGRVAGQINLITSVIADGYITGAIWRRARCSKNKSRGLQM